MKITVAPEDAGRIDKALVRHFPGAGRRQLAELFDSGAVRVRGAKAKKGDRVTAGDVIELTRQPASGDDLRPQSDPSIALTDLGSADVRSPASTTQNRIDILLERADLIAVAKPAGIPSQPLRAGELGTVANAIVARFPECATIGTDDARRDGGLVHRLDIGTSGVLLAARTPNMYRVLREAFRARQVTKTYLALVDGRPVSSECDVPLSQRGDHVAVDYSNGLFAHTAFVVERATATHALVRCTAQTGRMHQIRAHLAHVGSPIAGDTRYGGKPIDDHVGFFLHAVTLAAVLSGETLTVEAPIPDRFAHALAAVGL